MCLRCTRGELRFGFSYYLNVRFSVGSQKDEALPQLQKLDWPARVKSDSGAKCNSPFVPVMMQFGTKG